MKLDIFGKPIQPRPKCKHCGKVDWDHNAKTRECPAGMKHRTMGYTRFGPTKFEARQMTLKRSGEMKRPTSLTRSAFKRGDVTAERKRRSRKCVTCRTPFEPRSMTHKACKPECAALHVVAEKVRKDRRERQEGLAKLKRRADYLKEAQVAFNRFIRKRDQLAGLMCISSGRPLDWTGNAVDAGHYCSTGSAPHLRFNEDNCHAQSKHDNQYKSGNAVDYRIRLILRIGLARVEALEADDTPRKWTIDDLKAIKAHYTDKYKQLLRAG